MGLCGFNQYRKQKRQRQRRELLRLSNVEAAAVVVKEKLSLEKAQQSDSSKKELSANSVGLSFDNEKKPVQERKIRKRIKKEV